MQIDAPETMSPMNATVTDDLPYIVFVSPANVDPDDIACMALAAVWGLLACGERLHCVGPLDGGAALVKAIVAFNAAYESAGFKSLSAPQAPFARSVGPIP